MVKRRLQLFGEVDVGGGDDAGRRVAGDDLVDQVRAGEHRAGLAGRDLAHHLGHAPEGALLDPLGEAHDGGGGGQVRSAGGQHRPEPVGRNRHHHDVGPAQGFLQRCRGPQVRWAAGGRAGSRGSCGRCRWPPPAPAGGPTARWDTGRGHGGHRRPPRAGAHDRHLHDSGTSPPGQPYRATSARLQQRGDYCRDSCRARCAARPRRRRSRGSGSRTWSPRRPRRRWPPNRRRFPSWPPSAAASPRPSPDRRPAPGPGRCRGRRSRWGLPPSARSSHRPAGGRTRRATLRQ